MPRLTDSSTISCENDQENFSTSLKHDSRDCSTS